ncbi:MAG: STAS domain-containing protein [Planctomycetes bacterium]|nr:STAS domain-containing protein [Planctomycetota bacterium]
MSANVTVSVREIQSPPALIFEITGTMDSSKDLEYIAGVIESSDKELFLLSMSGVDYINSAGVGEIISISHSVKEAGKKLCFAGMHPYVRGVFELLGGHYFVPVYDSEAEALAAQGQQ